MMPDIRLEYVAKRYRIEKPLAKSSHSYVYAGIQTW